MKSREIHTLAEAKALELILREAAAGTVARITQLVRESEPLAVLEEMKFKALGCDPLDPSRPLNLIEQVNQTFTYLVTVRAVEFLLELHPECAPYRVNLGTAGGTDVESVYGSLGAEVFAAVKPGNNQKLAKDIARVRRTGAAHKYVFFYSPGEFDLRAEEDVKIVRLDLGIPGELASPER